MMRALLAALLLAPLAAAADSFVWTVSDDDSTLYLIGSMHLLPDEAYPLPVAMTRAYEQAERLVFEADLAALQSPAVQLSLLSKAQNLDGPPLREQLGPDLHRDFLALVREYELPVISFEAMHPWFASLSLELANYQRAGFRPDRGVDQHFHNLALADGKPRQGLESVDAHMALLTGMSGDDNGVAMLAATVAQLSDKPDMAQALYTAWRDGDVATMQALVAPLRRDSPDAYAHLLTNRNAAWMPKLQALLAGDEDVAAVVGALHLVGEGGLVDLFLKAGQVPVQQ